MTRNVLLVHQSADLYGSDRMLLRVIDAIRAGGGHPIAVLPSSGQLGEALRDHGAEVHVAPVGKLTRASLSIRGSARLMGDLWDVSGALDQIVARRSIDLVHSNTLAVLGGALWARRRRIAHCWHVHEIVETPKLAERSFVRALEWGADLVICNSRSTAQWLSTASRTRVDSRIRVIRNAIRPPDRTDREEVERYRMLFNRGDSSAITIGLVGRVNGQKGHDLLLNAAERLASRGLSGFSLVFVGDAPAGGRSYLSALEDRISRSSVRDRTVRVPFVLNPWPVYAALDIVCVPTQQTESFGLVALEAMHQGRPVVASRVQGLTELIDDGRTGLMFDPRDVDQLADHLAHLVQDGERRGQLGRDAQEHVEVNLDATHFERQLLQAYRELSPYW
jgi:glycosyltransferase involved in cell wall biosynthesis